MGKVYREKIPNVDTLFCLLKSFFSSLIYLCPFHCIFLFKYVFLSVSIFVLPFSVPTIFYNSCTTGITLDLDLRSSGLYLVM
jgi:hypothetical protein